MTINYNQLRDLVTSDAWRQTVGLWLDQAIEDATREMAYATNLDEVAVARGSYRALDRLRSRVTSLLEEGERLRLKAIETKKE